MDLISIILLAIGLSMDASAVSLSSFIVIEKVKVRDVLIMAFCFGLFQAAMPLIGWFAGSRFRYLIEKYDHWIAFILLCIIGGKMIYESFKKPEEKEAIDPMKILSLLGLSVATSIDALAAGLSFGFLRLPIVTVITIIGATTFTFSFVSGMIGKYVGAKFSSRMEFIGGIILFGIGIKIFLQHIITQV
ncbi:MAG: manganese efflux pump MntP family protein [Candidatus Omnitrophota bacterium]